MRSAVEHLTEPASAEPAAGPPRAAGRGRHTLLDALGVAWLALVVFLLLSPAIKDGPSFGPADLGRSLSVLTSAPAPAPLVHDNINGDIVTQDVAWNTLDWRLVHHGEVPLWDGLSGNGMPQLLNFESAPFALPSLLGYLFPLSLSFLVTVAMKLLIAGTGTYVLVRLLGGRPVAAALAGTSCMLSGSFAGWLGWAVSGPLAWTGWIAAFCVLAYRGRRPAPAVAGLALSAAFCIYGGFPESYVLLVIGLAVMLAATAIATAAARRALSPAGAARIAAGTLAGAALSAPLWLPGLAVIRGSIRTGRASSGLPLRDVLLVFAQGYDGLPLQTAAAPRSTWFGGSPPYFETAAYLGVVAIVLAVVAVALAWRRPVVVGLSATAVATGLVVYQLPGAPVQRALTAAGLGGVALQRMLPVLGFAVAVLAGLGLELALRHWRERSLHLALGCATALVALALAVMWVKSGSVGLIPEGPPTDPGAAAIPAAPVRRASLLWPTGEVAGLALVAAWLPLAARGRLRPAFLRRRGGRGSAGGVAAGTPALALAALGAQSAFLLLAGAGINSYAPSSYPVTPAVAQLQRLVGTTGLLGLDGINQTCAGSPGGLCGVRQWTGIGLYPVMNVAYGIDELAVHDPLAPRSYFTSWPVPDAGQTSGGTNLFAPAVDSLALARRYGVTDVIVFPHQPVPAGMRPIGTLRGTGLLIASVPGSSRASFPVGQGRVTSFSQPGDASYRAVVDVPAGSDRRLVVRVTDVPGWGATVDGRPATLQRGVDGAFLAVEVPPGRSVVVLRYAPALLGAGYMLALLALLGCLAGLLGGPAVRLLRRRRLTASNTRS